MRCLLTTNAIGRWILVHPENQLLGWSGSRWVPMDERGLPIIVQVSNFDTEDAAYNYAVESGFKSITIAM